MRSWALVGSLLAFVAADATPAFAQARPFQGIFGAQAAVAQPPRTLDVSATMSGVYDSRAPQFRARLQTEAADQTLYYNDVNVGLWYTQRGEHTLFSVNGATAVQQYPQIGNAVRQSGIGAVAFATTTQRSSFRVEQQLRYSPFHGFRIVTVPNSSSVPADVAAPDAALAVSGRPSYESNSLMGWGYQLTDRTSLNAEYVHTYLNFVEAPEPDWRTQDARVAWRRDITRRAALVLGYNYHRRDFQDLTIPVVRHDLDFGVNYGGTVPFSTRTTFDVSVGSTLISGTQLSTVGQDDKLVRMTGQADVDHQLSRTWHLGLSYNRGWQYIEGLPELFFAYSVTGSVGGYLGPRVDVRATTGYSTGGLRFSGHQRAYDTDTSTARVRVAVSRNFAVQGEYVYYRYLFSDFVPLPTGIAPRDNRHVFRVGLTTWFPFLQ